MNIHLNHLYQFRLDLGVALSFKLMLKFTIFHSIMRSSTWITMLIALFMFQSVWNVAAAFCVHEKLGQNNQPSMHFGHHEATVHDLMREAHQQNSKKILDYSSSYSMDEGQQAIDKFQSSDDIQSSDQKRSDQSHQQFQVDLTEDDHTDHLPSMGHLILSKIKTVELHPKSILHVQPEYRWTNAYQSPDLIDQTPPPEFSPLMVG